MEGQRRVIRQKGLTLLELAVGVALLTVVIGVPIVLLARTQQHLADELDIAAASQSVRKTLDRLQDELLAAEPDSLKPMVIDNAISITYSRVEAFDGQQQLSEPRAVFHQLALGETRNGKDDNGDGRIDEGWVILKETPSSPGHAIAADVTDLRFTAVNGGLDVLVQVSVSLDDGTVVQRSAERQISFRN